MSAPNQTLTEDAGPSRLVGLVGTIEGRRIPIDSPSMTLGRGADCEIDLDHAFLSRRHAAFDTDGAGRVVVRDLGSTQGTYVNGSRIDTSPLNDGDVVGFGPGGLVTFRFEATARESSARSAEPTLLDAAGTRRSAEPTLLDAAGTRRSAEPTLLDAAGTRRSAEPSSVDALRARFRTAGSAAVRTKPMPEVAAGPPPRVDPAAGPVVLRIGRAPDNDVVLNGPGVSRRHAQIDYAAGEPRLSDAGSLNGTFVNGEPVRGARPLAPTDLVFLGGFLLRVNGREISSHDLGASRLTASGITKSYGEKTVLHDVSFAILPKEFVGLMGPSGCGKSTLMDALNGLRPATRGAVLVNELDLYRNFDAVRRSIGYVPQQDILHDALTVERTLHYAARLRLPEDTPPEDARQVIDGVVQDVGLAEHRETSFKQLSGGQRKRLSLAIELLTKPTFLFLDEPTSPLDPETSENLMVLFRELADDGRIVVMVTHKFEKFEEMHQILLLTKGGHLAYFGPPRDALKYFECREPSELYRQVNARSPREVSQAFQTSEDFQTHVAARVAESNDAAAAARDFGAAADSPGPARSSGLRQWTILTRRYLEIKLKDGLNTLVLVGQAPAIAFILALIVGDTVNDSKTLFIGAIIAVWFGGNSAIREIVAELPIYSRERLVNLKIPPYLGSKFAVLGGIAFVQCLLFVGTLVAMDRVPADDAPAVAATLCLTAFGGVGLGLLSSAVVNSTEKAMSVLPLILIPQLLLSGFMKPLDDFYVNALTRAPASEDQYRDYERLTAADAPGGSASGDTVPGAAAADVPGAGAADASGGLALAGAVPAAAAEPVAMVEGLGNVNLASALILARWSVDGLVHWVSRTDAQTRDRLAGQFYVAAYDRIWDGGSAAAIEEAFRRRTYLNWLVLVLTTAAYLALAGVALKSKDSL